MTDASPSSGHPPPDGRPPPGRPPIDGRLLTDLDTMRRLASACVLLYSGGLDSSYFLAWAVRQGLPVVALRVDVGGRPATSPAVDVAEDLAAVVRTVDARAEFARDFVAPAIRANALHQGVFPISSSLSRPLMARLAVRLATEIGANCVLHTAELHQNSFARFNNAVRALAPHLHVGNPLLLQRRDRREKLDEVAAVIGGAPGAIYSIDANLWARVIENGELDSVTHPIPEHVFEWTAAVPERPRDSQPIRIRFASGLPVALDGEELDLVELIGRLNTRAGRYGIGRFNGMEGTRFRLKNHEVREAPAAALILAAHRHLEQLVLNDDELRVKDVVDHEWTRCAVLGHWYTDQHAALSAYQERIARPVTGDVNVALFAGGFLIDAISAPASLQEFGNPASLATRPGDLDLSAAFEIDTVDLAARRRRWIFDESGGERQSSTG